MPELRAHTISASPIPNGRGGLQYHCTTCGTLTYFQQPTLPCLGSLSEAHATIDALRAENETLRELMVAQMEFYEAHWRNRSDEA